MGEQDAQVLDGRDQVILDLLSPEPPPTRPLEMMIVCRISKTAFHQVMTSFAVTSCRRAVSLSARYI
jgi:hypothetical protein